MNDIDIVIYSIDDIFLNIVENDIYTININNEEEPLLTLDNV